MTQAMHTPKRVLVLASASVAAVLLALLRPPWCAPVIPASRPNKTGATHHGREAPETPAVPIDPAALATATAPRTGEEHSKGVSELVELAKRRYPLTVEDAQALLAFIAAPKPADLTDGDWQERINVILNLLRQQASVPGLTDYLFAMAEKNPSKVLRLYAMQHISLWYAKEGDPAQRRAMVELLEKLASTPGDETAGCAVLMLSDMRRKVTEDLETEDGRQAGASSLAGSFAIDGHRPPLQGAAVDWGAVDRVLARESLRLIGDGKAGQDVRISAIHAAVDRGDAGPLPELRKIAADTALVSTLRKAAIHAIGQLGAAEDATLLESLPQADGNLSMAVQPARKALAKRNAADPPTNRR
jgi:hypothetical protein